MSAGVKTKSVCAYGANGDGDQALVPFLTQVAPQLNTLAKRVMSERRSSRIDSSTTIHLHKSGGLLA